MEEVAFLEMFPFCEPLQVSYGSLEGVSGVSIAADWPQREASRPQEKAGAGKALLGRAIKGRPIPIREASPEMKSVVVSGRVFAADSREIPRRGAVVLQFDMTDGDGCVRVSRFFPRKRRRSTLSSARSSRGCT